MLRYRRWVEYMPPEFGWFGAFWHFRDPPLEEIPFGRCVGLPNGKNLQRGSPGGRAGPAKFPAVTQSSACLEKARRDLIGWAAVERFVDLDHGPDGALLSGDDDSCLSQSFRQHI